MADTPDTSALDPDITQDPEISITESASTDDSSEMTRLARTLVQALVAAITTWLFTKFGVHVDPDVAVKFVFPAALVIITGLVHQLGKLPLVGPYVLLLNGPRRQVLYAAKIQRTSTGLRAGILNKRR